MKNTTRILMTLLITLLFFIGCEDKPLSFEPENNANENISLSKKWGLESELFIVRKALRFIKQAQDKIAKATEKADKAPSDVDVTTVYAKIAEAEAKLLEAQTYYDNDDYAEAIASAKAAKELASEALDLLEDILDAAEEDD